MRKDLNLRADIARGLLFAFLVNTFGPIPSSQAQEFRLPAPGVMVRLSPEFKPPILKGIKVHPDNPFRFDFILDQGDSSVIPAKTGIQRQPKARAPRACPGGNHNQKQLKQEAIKLIKYFLASLTIPEKDLWVNLSPYEKNRIVPESFGQTEMGRDLLAEDYMLKQITASLIYPEDEVGRRFWKRIYEEAVKRYGTTNMPVNTFNKVWIVPEKAMVYENAKAGTAYVVESKLKVMLEQDYLALNKHLSMRNDIASIGANIVREIVIPELYKEVNEGKNFVQLRQVYNSLILATWYKKKIKDSILAQVYADKNKVVGVNIDDPQEKEKIYQQYLQAFKKGVYNYIKEDYDPSTKQAIPRKYFSGGTSLQMNRAYLETPDPLSLPSGSLDNAMIIEVNAKPVDKAMNSMGFGMNIKLEQKLTHAMKLQLQSLLLQLKLDVPVPPNAVTGKKGLEIANKILEEQNAVGIVIGSTSVSLHNRLAKDERLQKHKDIDVVVLSPRFKLKKPFDGGIDWWIPESVKLNIKYEHAALEGSERTIFVNGNNVYLRSGIAINQDLERLKPGLYLPDRDFLINLTGSVVMSRVHVEVPRQVQEAFRRRLDGLIGKGLSPVWRESFGQGRILSNLGVDIFDKEIVGAITKDTPYRDVGDRQGEAKEIKQQSQKARKKGVVDKAMKAGNIAQLARQAMRALRRLPDNPFLHLISQDQYNPRGFLDFLSSKSARRIFEGGPIAQPSFFAAIERDQKDLEEARQVKPKIAFVDSSYNASYVQPSDVRTFESIMRGIKEGNIHLPLIFKRNRNAGGSGIFYLEKSPDNPYQYVLTFAYVITGRFRDQNGKLSFLMEQFPGIQFEFKKDQHILQMTVDTRKYDLSEVLTRIWHLLSRKAREGLIFYDSGVVESTVPLKRFVPSGDSLHEQKAYEIRYIFHGQLTKGFQLNRNDSYARTGSSKYFVTLYRRTPIAQRWPYERMYWPLFQMFNVAPEKRQIFVAHLERLAEEEMRYLALRIKAARIVDESEVNVELDLGIQENLDARGLPQPILIEKTFHGELGEDISLLELDGDWLKGRNSLTNRKGDNSQLAHPGDQAMKVKSEEEVIRNLRSIYEEWQQHPQIDSAKRFNLVGVLGQLIVDEKGRGILIFADRLLGRDLFAAEILRQHGNFRFVTKDLVLLSVQDGKIFAGYDPMTRNAISDSFELYYQDKDDGYKKKKFLVPPQQRHMDFVRVHKIVEMKTGNTVPNKEFAGTSQIIGLFRKYVKLVHQSTREAEKIVDNKLGKPGPGSAKTIADLPQVLAYLRKHAEMMRPFYEKEFERRLAEISSQNIRLALEEIILPDGEEKSFSDIGTIIKDIVTIPTGSTEPAKRPSGGDAAMVSGGENENNPRPILGAQYFKIDGKENQDRWDARLAQLDNEFLTPFNIVPQFGEAWLKTYRTIPSVIKNNIIGEAGSFLKSYDYLELPGIPVDVEDSLSFKAFDKILEVAIQDHVMFKKSVDKILAEKIEPSVALRRKIAQFGNFRIELFWKNDLGLTLEEKILLTLEQTKISDDFSLGLLKKLAELSVADLQIIKDKFVQLNDKYERAVTWFLMRAFPYVKEFVLYRGLKTQLYQEVMMWVEDPTYMAFRRETSEPYTAPAGQLVGARVPLGAIQRFRHFSDGEDEALVRAGEYQILSRSELDNLAQLASPSYHNAAMTGEGVNEADHGILEQGTIEEIMARPVDRRLSLKILGGTVAALTTNLLGSLEAVARMKSPQGSRKRLTVQNVPAPLVVDQSTANKEQIKKEIEALSQEGRIFLDTDILIQKVIDLMLVDLREGLAVYLEVEKKYSQALWKNLSHEGVDHALSERAPMPELAQRFSEEIKHNQHFSDEVIGLIDIVKSGSPQEAILVDALHHLKDLPLPVVDALALRLKGASGQVKDNLFEIVVHNYRITFWDSFPFSRSMTKRIMDEVLMQIGKDVLKEMQDKLFNTLYDGGETKKFIEERMDLYLEFIEDIFPYGTASANSHFSISRKSFTSVDGLRHSLVHEIGHNVLKLYGVKDLGDIPMEQKIIHEFFAYLTEAVFYERGAKEVEVEPFDPHKTAGLQVKAVLQGLSDKGIKINFQNLWMSALVSLNQKKSREEVVRNIFEDAGYKGEFQEQKVKESDKVIFVPLGSIIQDHAMLIEQGTINFTNYSKGGIDLTPANMNLETKMDSRFRGNDRVGYGNDKEGGGNDKGSNGNDSENNENDNGGIKFHLDPAMLQQLQNVPGFVPVIINIQPLPAGQAGMRDLRTFLGLNEKVERKA